jgi:hypothetical protein
MLTEAWCGGTFGRYLKTTVMKTTATKAYTPTSGDDYNPNFLFSGTYTELLCAIANGHIDPKELAHKELRNRGLDNSGQWVGFDK